MNTLLLLLSMLAGSPSSDEPVQSVELVLQTRGARKSITMDARQTRVDINGQRSQQPTQPKQWRAVLQALNPVRLNDLPTLTGNTARSSVDAAFMARVRVTTTAQTYESATFDHSNPPTALIQLVNAIVGSAPAGSRSEFR